MKFKILLEESITELDIPQYLYHATYPHRWKKIQQTGGLKTTLSRQARNWSDSRNVICLSADPDVAESYAETALDELDRDWDIIILKIDTSNLDKTAFDYDQNILYDEEDAEEGFERTEYEYSKDIPLSCISIFDSSQEEQLNEVKSSNELSIEDLCKQVNHKLNAFGGNCGAFALAMHNKLTPLHYKIEIIFCSDYYQIMNGEEQTEEDEFDYLLEGEPNIYHVAFRVNKNKIYDGQGIQQIEDLEEFCYEWYRDPNPCISAFTIDDEDDYRRFDQIIRWNTNLHNSVEDFEEIIDECLNNKSLTESKKKKKKSTNKLKPIFKDHNDLLAWVKKRQKGMSPWGSFNSDAGNVELSNCIFNSMMSSADGASVGISDGGLSNGGLSGGIGESLSFEDDKYYRVEVLNQNDNLMGGLFRGLNDLINDLWDSDDPMYDNINDPLSRLEYETYYPKEFKNTDAIFAYKENKYKELEETILELKAELNILGWDLNIKIINRPQNIVYEDDEQIAYIFSVKENTNIIKNKNGALNEKMENQELRYTVKKYGQWWWGIIDHTLNNGSGLMMRAGVNPDYNAPLDKGENKLLLFKSKELAQEHCDKLNKKILSESNDMNEDLISGNYVWCGYSDIVGMNIYELCKFVEDKYKDKYYKDIKVSNIEDQSYDYTNKELPFIVRVEDGEDFWFVIHCTEEEAKNLTTDNEYHEDIKVEESMTTYNEVKIGDKIRIINMIGEPQYTGKEGVVNHIDDRGQIHGTWGGCAIIPEDDEFEILTEKVNENKDVKICSICGKEYEGYGNNAQPVNDGICCDECNMSKVIPARLQMMRESVNNEIERFIDSDTSLSSKDGEVHFGNGDVRPIETIYLYKDGNDCYLKGYAHSFKNSYSWTVLSYDEIDQFDESDKQFFAHDKVTIIDIIGLVNKYKQYFQTNDIFIDECLTDVNEAFDLLNKLED